MHHSSPATLEHCQNVAWVSYLINKKLKLNADEKKLIELAMMHDRLLYGCDNEKPEKKSRFFKRSATSCDQDEKHFDLSKEDQEVLRSHMWPLNIKGIPTSKEAIIFCVADKYCKLIETLRINEKLGLK